MKPLRGAKKTGMLKDMNNHNIIERGRTQRDAHAVALKDATTSLNAYYTAFAAFILSWLFYSAVLATIATKKVEQLKTLRMHCDYLPAEPDNWSQMIKHKLATGFRQAARDKIKALEAKNTWIEVL